MTREPTGTGLGALVLAALVAGLVVAGRVFA